MVSRFQGHKIVDVGSNRKRVGPMGLPVDPQYSK